MKSKHQKILEYIKSLPIGSKISVRQVAKELKVSEGTAYRAIKESENRGFVSSINSSFVECYNNIPSESLLYNLLYSIPKDNGVWKALYNTVGDNSKRPVLPYRFDGCDFYDTSINKSIIYDGTSWRSSDGELADIPRSGSYANRPRSSSTYPPTNVGFQYFNTDTHKMMFFGGDDVYYYADGTIATA